MLEKVGLNPYYGQQLEDDVRNGLRKQGKITAEISTRKIARPSGNHYQEVLVRAKEILKVAERLGCGCEVEIFKDIIKDLDFGDTNERPYFRTPDLRVVVVNFQRGS